MISWNRNRIAKNNYIYKVIKFNSYLYLECERNKFAIDKDILLAYFDAIETTHIFLLTEFTFYCS